MRDTHLRDMREVRIPLPPPEKWARSRSCPSCQFCVECSSPRGRTDDASEPTANASGERTFTQPDALGYEERDAFRLFIALSFDLAAFSGKRALTREQVVDAYVRAADNPDEWESLLEADPAVDAFVAEITSRWPQIDDVPEDEIDDCPWNVEFDKSPAHVSSAIAWSRADEVSPVYVAAALRHGLYVYDPQDDWVYAPTNHAE